MYSTDFKSMLPDLVVFLPASMDRAPALLQDAGGLAGGFSDGGLSFSCPRAWNEHQRCSRAPAVSPAASRAAAAAASGDSNKAALGRR